jgi:hypothetical protein
MTRAPEGDMAEGSTLAPFKEYLTLQNPSSTVASVELHYATEYGDHPVKTLSLPAESRTSIEVFNGDTVTNTNPCLPNGPGASCGVGPGVGGASVQVLSTNAVPIIVERPFYVGGHDFGSGTIPDAHDSFGVNAPANTWYFSEGTTLAGFNEYLTVQNPNGNAATVTLTYNTDTGLTVQKTFSLPARTRETIEVFSGNTSNGPCNALGGVQTCGVGSGIGGVAVRVSSSGATIVAERPMYIVRDFGAGTVFGAHVVVGSHAPTLLSGFAALSTAYGEFDFLTIQNPNSQSANLTLTYYTGSGAPVVRNLTVNANTRKTVQVFDNVDGVGGDIPLLGVVLSVTNAVPVVVEKPTYSSFYSKGATTTLGYSPPNGF